MRFWSLWRYERKWPPTELALMGVVASLEEMCNCGGGLRGLTYAQVMTTETVHFRVPARCRTPSYLSRTMYTTMSHHRDNGMNL